MGFSAISIKPHRYFCVKDAFCLKGGTTKWTTTKCFIKQRDFYEEIFCFDCCDNR